MKLKVGEKAPLFEGLTDEGSKFSLEQVIGSKNLILYFYPKDMTPGCTKEACGFRDNWDRIVSLDAIVLGVSSQDPKSHLEFKTRNNLPFTLISDTKDEIRKLYGATSVLLPPRVTFVIDKRGEIRYIFNSQLNITKHISDALENLLLIEKEETKNGPAGAEPSLSSPSA